MEPPIVPDGPSNVAASSEPILESFPHDELHSHADADQSTETNLRPFRRESNNHISLIIIGHVLLDANGQITKAHLRVNDVFVLLGGKKIILEWNELGQPIRESGGLLGQFLGHSKIPASCKDHVWNNIIRDKFDISNELHKKYIMGNLEKKWRGNRSRLFTECYDPVLSWEANLEKRPTYIPKEQWAGFLEKSYKCQTQLSSEDDAYTTVFGKEYPRRIRSVGQGVCPSQMSRSTSRAGGSLSSNYILKSEYDASMERMQKKMEENDTKIKSLKNALAYMMQHMGGSLPSSFPNINEVEDLGSLAPVQTPRDFRRSSSSSHEPQNQASSSRHV
ncbi:hypothetical protein CDL12_13737 [Handroanthus impetiginosus]|uniref:Transposase Tnp1/En/Spm-like domain-containing protein n=1 Tax=Handroanthus impetiginosus TaxID=429701 RepID=A0A2G9H807_9LAMI|nr:hypothetical protein CDL12_13737 [Handroanthus impetiginosus]